MNQIKLVTPSKTYEYQVMDYRMEMIKNNDHLDGCAGLEDVDSYAEWLDFDTRLSENMVRAMSLPLFIWLLEFLIIN